VTAARPGTVHFELDIQKEHTNRLNILHGGTLACMTDLGGSLAVASRGLFATGVSTDLSGKTLPLVHCCIMKLLARANSSNTPQTNRK
jgi:acyl-coenzyme A thioesterase PaaI-like protein